MRITKIVFENYRQFIRAEIKFPLSNKMDIVFGKNGSGKTTCVEAIEWVLNDKLRLTPNIVNAELASELEIGKCIKVEVTVYFQCEENEYIRSKYGIFQKRKEGLIYLEKMESTSMIKDHSGRWSTYSPEYKITERAELCFHADNYKDYFGNKKRAISTFIKLFQSKESQEIFEHCKKSIYEIDRQLQRMSDDKIKDGTMSRKSTS